jgi:hypothetical protein
MSNSERGGKSPSDATDAQPAVTALDLRTRITDRAELNDTVTKGTVIADVARDANVPKSRVEREFQNLHANGFIYTVGDGDTAEVRTP